MSDDLVRRLRANGLDECDEAIIYIEALERQVKAADALAKHASAQLDYMDLCNDKGDFERNLRAALAAYHATKEGGA